MMSKRNQLIAVGMLCLTAAGAAGISWRSGFSRAPVASTKAQASPSRQSVTPSAVTGVPDAQAAEVDYAVNFETTLVVAQGPRSRITGHLGMTLAEQERTDGKLVLSGKLKDITLVVEEGDEATRAAVEEGLTKDLERSFALVLDAGGKILQLGAAATLSPGTESILRAAVSALQFSAGPGSGAKTWKSVETDHYGTFQADYRLLSSDQVEKRKAYTQLSLPNALRMPEAAGKGSAKGQATYSLAATGRWPLRVEATDEADLGLLRIAQRFTLTLEARRARQPARVDLSRLQLSSLDSVPTRKQVDAGGDGFARQLVQGASYDELLSDLSRLGDGDDEATSRHEALRRLSALFELDPQAVSRAAQALRDGKTGKETSALLGALASANSVEARRALHGMAVDPALPAPLRNDVLNNINVDPRATPESFATLTALSSDADPQLRKSAILALGSTVRSAESDSAASRDAERASRSLQQGLQSAQTSGERSLFLKALGNSGSNDALAAAKAALSDLDASVRRDAVRALRFVPGDEADRLIVGAWLNDGDEDVREAGPFAASYRALTPILAEAALTSLAKDAVESVRLRSLAFVAENAAQQPKFASAVAVAAQQDPSEEVRQNARRYLGNI